MLKEYNHLFHGRGRLGDDYKIQTDESITPIVNAPRKVPFTLMKDLKKKLFDMEKLGYIKKVVKPSDWVSSLVVVRKPNGKLRVCIDPSNLNKSIKR